MRLIIDANVAFSFFKKNSFTRILIENKSLSLFAPELLFVEIKKYRLEIQKKCSLTDKEFLQEINQLKNIVAFVAVRNYEESLLTAKSFSPDPWDVEYLALAQHLQCPLWSQDKFLKTQDKILVLTTTDVAEIVSQD